MKYLFLSTSIHPLAFWKSRSRRLLHKKNLNWRPTYLFIIPMAVLMSTFHLFEIFSYSRDATVLKNFLAFILGFVWIHICGIQCNYHTVNYMWRCDEITSELFIYTQNEKQREWKIPPIIKQCSNFVKKGRGRVGKANRAERERERERREEGECSIIVTQLWITGHISMWTHFLIASPWNTRECKKVKFINMEYGKVWFKLKVKSYISSRS